MLEMSVYTSNYWDGMVSKLYIFLLAAATAIFDGDLKFNGTSLHQVCKTKSCAEACDF